MWHSVKCLQCLLKIYYQSSCLYSCRNDQKMQNHWNVIEGWTQEMMRQWILAVFYFPKILRRKHQISTRDLVLSCTGKIKWHCRIINQMEGHLWEPTQTLRLQCGQRIHGKWLTVVENDHQKPPTHDLNKIAQRWITSEFRWGPTLPILAHFCLMLWKTLQNNVGPI